MEFKDDNDYENERQLLLNGVPTKLYTNSDLLVKLAP